MEYGSILAKQFDVPQRAQQGQLGGRGRAAAPAQAKDDFKLNEFLEKAPEGLERSSPDIAKQTAQYYQNWNELRSFAKTMWAKYKIDVQTPDPSNPDSIWANQAYNQKLGLLLDGVDNARNSQKEWERRQTALTESKLLERQGYTPQGYSANSSVTEGYIPTGADPRIGVAKEISGQFDTGVNQRNKMLGDMRSGLETTYGNDPERLAYQQALAQPLLASQNVKSDGGGAGSSNTEAALKEYALLAEGSGRYFKLPEKPKYTREGRPLYEATPTGWVGSRFGQKNDGPNKGRDFVISSVLYDYGDPKNPSDGQAYFVDAEGEKVAVDKRNIANGFRSFIDSNRGMYSKADYEKFLQTKGLGTDIIPARRLLDVETDLPEIASTQAKAKQFTGTIQPQVRQAFDSYLSNLDLLNQKTPRTAFGVEIPFTEKSVLDRATIPLADGQIAEILPVKNQQGVFKIDNWNQIFPKNAKGDVVVGNRTYSKGQFGKLTREELFELLNYVGIDPAQAPATQTDKWSQYKTQ